MDKYFEYLNEKNIKEDYMGQILLVPSIELRDLIIVSLNNI